ncbi:hypothetical protein V3W47_16675 [Deinococcus sp. YIM 134068]|uniref:hypothetical protein n=1 Tax=Deinococcus lichenicola TaxID=3118910 RepID=UPI002F91F502
MYTTLHGIRAHISDVRPGYRGTDFNYESLPRILQRDIPNPLDEMAAAFVLLKRICHAARYECKDQRWLERKFPEAQAAYEDILRELRAVNVLL